MSYYIKPVTELKPGYMAVYRVVKRLRDFKPDDGVEYMVFKSRKAMKNDFFVDLYCGKKGKLVKLKNKSMMRF
tara:strand:+ start:299 stop:517 length:219 start_codon:yes stop_codon:yes gene_type:complete